MSEKLKISQTDLDAITPDQLFNRWVGDRDASAIPAKEAFVAARTIAATTPFVAQSVSDGRAQQLCVDIARKVLSELGYRTNAHQAAASLVARMAKVVADTLSEAHEMAELRQRIAATCEYIDEAHAGLVSGTPMPEEYRGRGADEIIQSKINAQVDGASDSHGVDIPNEATLLQWKDRAIAAEESLNLITNKLADISARNYVDTQRSSATGKFDALSDQDLRIVSPIHGWGARHAYAEGWAAHAKLIVNKLFPKDGAKK